MGEVKLSERTQALLSDPVLGDQDTDAKIIRLLEAEYIRQLGRYRRTDRRLAQKYQMSFDDFHERRVTVQHNNSWEVEKDAMDWETAIGGILTMQRKLKEIRQPTHAENN
jgi:hypothetical protein